MPLPDFPAPPGVRAPVRGDETGEGTVDALTEQSQAAPDAAPTGRRAARAAEARAAEAEPVAEAPLDAEPVAEPPVEVEAESEIEVERGPEPDPVEPAPEPEPEPKPTPEIPFAELLMSPPVSASFPAPLSAVADPEAAQVPVSSDSPNLADFLGSRPTVATGPAEQGWQGTVTRVTGGLITFPPGGAERAERTAIESVQRSLVGPRTIVVLNPKGGAHKTTATLLIAATFGIYRGGFTLAWDNNETMGTLGVRARAAKHTNTAVDLLRDLRESGGERATRVGDLDKYVRAQGDAQFDALASDLDPAGAASIDAAAFSTLHERLSRFYRILVDTGNNMRASNWEAAVDAADQLVIVSTIREDTGFGAAALIDGLRRKGHGEKVADAVTVLASPSKTVDAQLSQRLHTHFAQLTRTVLDVPFDASLVSGGPLNVDALAPRTRAAWLLATAAIAEGL
ncbi:MAG: chromosome partitioning protein [Cryobacterium sp.]